ncbi:MAG: MraY family glycosyltransferase [Propionibacteriaceae bacterium]|nr:MraY family glycosyltransferase [Propionibacteriaceae bacterium]
MREYLLILLVAAAATYLLSGLARQVAERVGAVAKVRDRDVHTVPIPYFGGVAMLGGTALAFLLASQLPFLGKHSTVAYDTSVVLIAGALICGIGVIDDLLDLPAAAKFGGQCLAAGIIVVGGVRIFWIPLPNSIFALDDSLSIALTLVFILVCTNAVNFVDGLDGLAAGVVAIGAGAFFTYTYVLAYEQGLVRATTASLITVVICGVCLGFLPHNLHRARMFMGDSGAMLLGLLMAASSISFTGQFDPAALEVRAGDLLPTVLPIVLPVAIMVLPFLDLILAWVRRTMAGQWWFVADKQHLHHQLIARGHSHRAAVALMYAWTAVISFGLVGVGITQNLLLAGVFAGAGVLVLVLTLRPLPVKSGRE